MYINAMFLASLVATTTTQAFNFTVEPQTAASSPRRALLPNLLHWAKSFTPRNAPAACPPIWSEISTTLTAQFLADGQCTDAARAAIRSAFHDCFNGACDGSLILANECSNSENRGLEQVCSSLASIAADKKVGTADLIQFAAAHAIKTCPGGPTVPVKIGRKDSSTANALGVLPGGNAAGSDLIQLFASKGFTHTDLAALIGAHTTARQRFENPSRAGVSLDSTVGTWDNRYFSETKKGTAPFTLQSDKNVAENLFTGVPFAAFALSKTAWDLAFVKAMAKMSMLGVEGEGLVDCTAALPGGSLKRDVKGAGLWDRLSW